MKIRAAFAKQLERPNLVALLLTAYSDGVADVHAEVPPSWYSDEIANQTIQTDVVRECIIEVSDDFVRGLFDTPLPTVEAVVSEVEK